MADSELTAKAREVLAEAYREEREAVDAYQRVCVWGDEDAVIRADRRVTAASERVSECIRLLSEVSSG